MQVQQGINSDDGIVPKGELFDICQDFVLKDKPYIFNYKNFMAHMRGVEPSAFEQIKTKPRDLEFTILDG